MQDLQAMLKGLDRLRKKTITKGVSMSTRSTPVFHKLRLLLQQWVEEQSPRGSMVISLRCVRKSL